MAQQNPRVGDIGIVFRFTIYNTDGVTPYDLSGGYTVTIRARKPDKSLVTWSAIIDADPTTGKVTYTTVSASDLNISGRWKMQCFVKKGSSIEFYTTIVKVKVEANA